MVRLGLARAAYSFSMTRRTPRIRCPGREDCLRSGSLRGWRWPGSASFDGLKRCARRLPVGARPGARRNLCALLGQPCWRWRRPRPAQEAFGWRTLGSVIASNRKGTESRRRMDLDRRPWSGSGRRRGPLFRPIPRRTTGFPRKRATRRRARIGRIGTTVGISPNRHGIRDLAAEASGRGRFDWGSRTVEREDAAEGRSKVSGF